jgi:alpha-galactosidase
MKDLADGIKEQGFVPGLWVAPFTVDPSTALFKEHPDWLVQGEKGPVIQEGVYTLDLTRPRVLDFIRDTFTRIFDQWGFEYVKIDFLYHAAVKGRRFDASQTTAAALRSGIKVIRDVAKDRFVLGCGTPLSPAIGLCDGMRVGYDVSSHWEFPVNTNIWPAGNFNIRAAAINAIWRQWMHAHWWQNDPDCLILRDFGSEVEKQIFQKHFKQIVDVTTYGLSDDEAMCWAQLIWFLGGAVIVSENLKMLPKTRFDLMDYSYPPNVSPARWVDWYDDPDVAVLISRGDCVMIGLFNLGDEPVKMRIPKEKFGLGHIWNFRERLSGDKFSGSGETVNFPAMGPHCGKIWILM